MNISCTYKHTDALEDAHFSGVRILHPYSDDKGSFALDELALEPHKHLVLQVESLFASGHGEKLQVLEAGDSVMVPIVDEHGEAQLIMMPKSGIEIA